MPDKALSDDEIYERLHEQWLLWQGLSAQTELGTDVIATAIRTTERLQTAMLMVKDGVTESET